MTIEAVRFGLTNESTSTTGVTHGATSQTEGKEIGKDTFLKLLVAQLKYQNPMEPTDSSQFMAQTAQFTMVEKLEEIAKQTDTLLAHQSSQTAASLLGRQVTYVGADGNRVTGVVTSARFSPTGSVVVGQTDVPLADIAEVTSPTA